MSTVEYLSIAGISLFAAVAAATVFKNSGKASHSPKEPSLKAYLRKSSHEYSSTSDESGSPSRPAVVVTLRRKNSKKSPPV